MRSLTVPERDLLICFLDVLPDASSKSILFAQVDAAQVYREDSEHRWFKMAGNVVPLGSEMLLEGGETISLQFSDVDGERIESVLHIRGGVIAWLEWYSLVIGRRLIAVPDARLVIR
jgi:hypothetical protein